LALRRAEVVFAKPGGGLTELPDFLWERALLCQGDYLLRSSSHGATWRLCVDAPQDPTSWKALLRGSLQDEGLRAKRAFALQVLREVDPDDLTGSLRRIVEAGPVDPVAANASWRAALIQAPQMLGYCEHRWLMLRWYQGDAGQWKQEVFLLWGQKRGSYQDVALWAEGEGLITAHQAGALAPLRPVELNKGSGTKVAPSIKLYLPRKKVASYVITRDRDTFTCQGRVPGAEPIFQCRRGELLERVRDLVASLSQGPTPGA
jgi:hypothetical protein